MGSTLDGEGGAAEIKVTHRLKTRSKRFEPKRAVPQRDLLCGEQVAEVLK